MQEKKENIKAWLKECKTNRKSESVTLIKISLFMQKVWLVPMSHLSFLWWKHYLKSSCYILYPGSSVVRKKSDKHWFQCEYIVLLKMYDWYEKLSLVSATWFIPDMRCNNALAVWVLITALCILSNWPQIGTISRKLVVF